MNPANLDQLPDIVDVFARWTTIAKRLAAALERTADREQPVEGLTVGDLWDVATMLSAMVNKMDEAMKSPVTCVGCDGRFTPDEIKAHVMACEAHPLARRIRALEAEREIVRRLAAEGYEHYWDNDRDMKAGKILLALAGRSGLQVALDAARDRVAEVTP